MCTNADVILGVEAPVQRDLLGKEADVGEKGRVLAGPAAEHRDLATGRPGQPGEQPQQRCLSGAVRADQRRYPAFGNGDGGLCEGGDLAVMLRQPARLDRGRVAAGHHAVSSSAAARNVTRNSDSIDSSSSPASRALRTHCVRVRASRECVPGGGPDGRPTTKVPSPARGSTRPSRSRSRYALRTVLGLTAVVATTSRTVGSLSPTSSTPIRSAWRTCWTICKYGGTTERPSSRKLITGLTPLKYYVVKTLDAVGNRCQRADFQHVDRMSVCRVIADIGAHVHARRVEVGAPLSGFAGRRRTTADDRTGI